jgi:hypothetical protein
MTQEPLQGQEAFLGWARAQATHVAIFLAESLKQKSFIGLGTMLTGLPNIRFERRADIHEAFLKLGCSPSAGTSSGVQSSLF